MTIDAAMRRLSEHGAEAGQPQRSYDAFARIFSDFPGYMLFSLSLCERDTWLRRIMSTAPDRHRLNGTKDMAGTGYCRAVLVRRSHLFSRNEDDLRANFQDHAAIIADGVGSAINVCLQFDGRVIGSANFLAGPHAYDEASFDYLTAFAFPLTLLVMHTAATLRAAQTQAGEAKPHD